LGEFAVRFSDTHSHLDFKEFDGCRGQLLKACKDSSIELVVVPAVVSHTWDKLKLLSEQYACVYAAYGLHPLFIDKHSEEDLELLSVWLATELGGKGKKVVAVGEIGLDISVGDMPKQQALFEGQLSLAAELALPVILHSRKMHAEVLKSIKRHKLVGGVFHAFSGSYEQLLEFTKLGVKIGVGGVITWPRSTKTRSAIARAPLESLVLETDSPDMYVNTDVDRGFDLQSTPLNVLDVFAALCTIRPEAPDVIAEQLWCNSQNIFFPK